MSRLGAVGTVLVVVLVLGLASPAGAHVEAIPAFLPANGTESLVFTVHNDIEEEMTSFAVTVPAGFAVDEVEDVEGWSASVDGPTAVWTGGTLAFQNAETFTLALEAPPEPGAVILDAEQRYSGDRALPWPVEVTVVPEDVESSTGYVWAVAALGVAVLAALGVAVVLRRRRAATP